jgi:hypothetical protein
MDDVAVGQHRALRLACRARGVEDHRGVLLAGLDRRRGRRVVCQHRETRQSRIVVDGDAVDYVGHIQRVWQTRRERRLVDQYLCAAIAEDIGDFRFLLARAEQHRDEPLMGGSKQQQREFDAVAEQDGDTIAALQSELAKTRGDPRSLLGGLPPA